MKQLIYIGILVITFVIGTSANALVMRAAYFFIPDVDRPTNKDVEHRHKQPDAPGCDYTRKSG